MNDQQKLLARYHEKLIETMGVAQRYQHALREISKTVPYDLITQLSMSSQESINHALSMPLVNPEDLKDGS